MKRLLTTFLLAGLAAVPVMQASRTLAIEGRKMSPALLENNIPASLQKADILYPTDVTPRPRISPDKKATTEMKEELLFEDFNNFPQGGYTDENGCEDMVANQYGSPGMYIDDEYTPESGTWAGHRVFLSPTPGCVRLQGFSMQQAALYLPIGDYSGDITVTMRVRWAKSFWPLQEGGYMHPATGRIGLAACIGGHEQWSRADSELGGGIYSDIFNESNGWMEVKFNFRNNSSNSDGFLSLYTS